MFEISGNDITSLSDSDLRSLVYRLAIAELKAKGYPRSSVTAGGHQDAPDGGIDVRVECPADITNPDFVPRRRTGFQVKKPDMPPADIHGEMRPNGILRDVIGELARDSGSYVIISSQGSVTDKALTARRHAMRDALSNLPEATQLHTDFYDRDRLATWVNEYPGTAIWVRSRVGRPLAGWSSIGNWDAASDQEPKPYLFNDKDCLIDESSHGREPLTVIKGIERLRARLRMPRQCIRLIGLSGLGKTRLVQALFEEGVGEEPLDLSLAVYTDYSEETIPTARDMARELIASGQRAILIVDNCNPNTHAELARHCSKDGSQVSLITVEYDVRDDEPEHTDVFRLQLGSLELVATWIKQEFTDLSEVDSRTIAGFSNGNFRVARALAETLGKGETIGSLKSLELFERIFRQRNPEDKQLLQAAQDLALLYSIDGEDILAEGELARVGAFRGVEAQLLYEELAEMRQRGVVQARGRFRAILPQAIANPLASRAIDRIPPDHFDKVCSMMTPRMLKSMSRRLGFLHDSPNVRAVVARWLRIDGPLGDLLSLSSGGIDIISNIAPVAPDAVLTKFERELQVSTNTYDPGRNACIRVIKAIGYDTQLFERTVLLLTRFVPTRGEAQNNVSHCEAFVECFHIYLSGTQATPAQRRAAIRRMAGSSDPQLRHCAQIALRALLQTGHFTTIGNCDFGARSRDWGWTPKVQKDIREWFEEAIKLVVEVAPETEARMLLAEGMRSLWRIRGCQDAINHAVTLFLQTRPWIEGWIACRAALNFDGKDMTEDNRSSLELLIDRLRPSDLLNQARAVVLNGKLGGSWNFADGESDDIDASKAYQKADEMAVDIGRALAIDAEVRKEFVNELVEGQPQRAFECGRGLAGGAEELNALWIELVTAYGSAALSVRNATVLGGFLWQAHQRDDKFAARVLDDAIHNSNLLPVLPYLQARVGLDAEGIARLRKAIAEVNMSASHFYSIANGSVSNSPPEPLAALLEDISQLPKGLNVALDILHMHFFSRQQKDGGDQNARLLSVGRNLLSRFEYGIDDSLRDYAAKGVIEVCLRGEEGREAAQQFCEHLSLALENYRISPHNLNYTLNALFEVQPFTALDAFILPAERRGIFEGDFGRKSPIENVDPVILQNWASSDPNARYPRLGHVLPIFTKNGDEDQDLSPLFLSLLEQAPEKRLFLGHLLDRLHPRSWGGSLADILIRRKSKVLKLAEHPDDEVRAAVIDLLPNLDIWIERERERDRAREESFE